MKHLRRLKNNRGILLVSSYFILSLFLIYSNALTLRTVTHRAATTYLHDRLQALDLAQGAMEQLRDDLYTYFASQVYQVTYQGNALQALDWLDALGRGQATTPTFDLANISGVAEGGGTSEGDPRRAVLPSGTGKAWIASIDSTDEGNMLAPRSITLDAKATVGGVTKRIRATYEIALGMSDIFRYVYFVNNYGWMTNGPNSFIQIDGEVRSNGDFTFDGNLDRLYMDGDLYASTNPGLVNPLTQEPAEGLLQGDPTEDWFGPGSGYFIGWGKLTTRPERRLTFPGQPTIGGGPTEYLPYGSGWDTDYPQQRFERQTTQDIPYLGNLDLYKNLALSHGDGAGSSLIYNAPGADGLYGTNDDVRTTMNAVSEQSGPMILVGTKAKPLVIDGPVVINGDVIIRGYVTGQGTIYAGRNVHVVGNVRYLYPPVWPRLIRNNQTGQIKGYGQTGFEQGIWYEDLGSVCTGGTYMPSSGGPPESRCN